MEELVNTVKLIGDVEIVGIIATLIVLAISRSKDAFIPSLNKLRARFRYLCHPSLITQGTCSVRACQFLNKYTGGTFSV